MLTALADCILNARVNHSIEGPSIYSPILCHPRNPRLYFICYKTSGWSFNKSRRGQADAAQPELNCELHWADHPRQQFHINPARQKIHLAVYICLSQESFLRYKTEFCTHLGYPMLCGDRTPCRDSPTRQLLHIPSQIHCGIAKCAQSPDHTAQKST